MSKNGKKIFIGVVIIVAICLFGFVISRAFFYYPSDEISLPQNIAEKITIDTPPTSSASTTTPSTPSATTAPAYIMTLSIPSIKVNAHVEELGITAKGNMAAPRVFSEVGWYKYGTFPGNTGSAVIAGHVDDGLAFPAVFANLDNLKPGDDIYLQTTPATRLHFVVTGSAIYDFDASPSEVSQVFSDKSGKYLNLITCSGTWIDELRTHDKRLVVSAVLAS